LVLTILTGFNFHKLVLKVSRELRAFRAFRVSKEFRVSRVSRD
jgi:hypothetical protein